MKMKNIIICLTMCFLMLHSYSQKKSKINLVSGAESANIKIENLGPQINTTFSEYVPVISPDGKTLYFYVDIAEQNIGEGDIWFSQLQKDGKWGKRQHFDNWINNEYDNFVISVSPDNNSLFLSRRYTFKKGELYDNGPGISISHRTKKGWSAPSDIKIKNFKNKSRYAEYCLSSDKKTLLLAIEGRNSLGMQDIYVSFLKDNGEWTEPKNLGEKVNTKESENSPFLAGDGITLYFASDGRPGYGLSDIYMTRRMDDSWTKWSEPENLGPNINTPKRDAYFSIPASGKYAYLVSEENSIGKADIFRIKLPEEIKPRPVVLIYGKVLNSETKEPLEANITYRDLETDKEMGIARSNPATGEYKIILPAGIRYAFFARKNDIITVSENIDVSKINEYEEVERDLYLTPIKVGSIVRMNNLWFKTGKDDINKLSYPEIGRLIELLENNPAMEIEIAGHTDNVGGSKINEELSLARATAVKNYLITQGIAESRMIAKGYSMDRPLVSNDTEEGRRKNRRVEFEILKL